MARKKKKPVYILLLLFTVAGIHYFRNYAQGSNESEREAYSSEIVSKDSLPAFPKGIEIPSAIPNRREQIIPHNGYTVSYNTDWCIPNWVAYELTDIETQGTVKRGNHFIPDPQVKGRTATTDDYTHSGYDRGHMAPAADMKWSTYAMAQCFYLSNICPQNNNLNKGDWKELEEKGRSWAQQYGNLYILCGPIVTNTRKTIGKNKVTVPKAFFKIFLRGTAQSPHAIAFIFENKAGSHPLQSYSVSVDEVERQSGIDFFSALPDSVEQRIEATCNPTQWQL